jgi:hypothetical protein
MPGSAGSHEGFAGAGAAGPEEGAAGYGSYDDAAMGRDRAGAGGSAGSESAAMTRGFLEGTGLSATALREFAIDDSLSDDYDSE